MTTASIVVIWAGYALASWGYCLIRGYDITFLSWVNPLSPYAWPSSGSPTTIPSGQVFP